MLPSSSLPAALCVALALSAELVSAVPSSLNGPASPAKGQSIPLRRRPQPRTTSEIRAQARRQADLLIAKYVKPASDGPTKRAGTASVPLTNYNVDFQYYGSISVVSFCV